MKYILHRLAATIPVMGIVAFLVFSLLYIAPGDPAVVIGGEQASEADIARIRESLGLNRPYLVRFGEWGWRVLHGDLGVSLFTQIPVSDLIVQRMEPTIALMALSMLISVTIAVPLGVLAAIHPGGWIDRFVIGLAVVGFSMPVFVVGYVLAYVFSVQLRWLPVQGYQPLSGGFWLFFKSLLLPSMALGLAYIALIARVTRAAMLEVLALDFLRTARAKGLPPSQIYFVHALKAAAVPIITVIGIGIGALIGGAVATESVFGIPGLGRLTVDSMIRLDYPVIQGVILLFSLTYVAINLIVDLLYRVVDPRIRY
ncbi:ABC transporter permease [Variovorax sp. LT1R20]|uniref:ABC transporter permease n=1 Tax=Variovorax sp. LT1R20 TaxID=3443729 RepID=UPI003F46F14F